MATESVGSGVASGEEGLSTSPFRLHQTRGNEDFPSLGSPGRDALQERLREWLGNFMSRLPRILSMAEEADVTEILDTRRVDTQQRIVLTGLAHCVHRTLHAAQPLKAATGPQTQNPIANGKWFALRALSYRGLRHGQAPRGRLRRNFSGSSSFPVLPHRRRRSSMRVTAATFSASGATLPSASPPPP